MTKKPTTSKSVELASGSSSHLGQSQIVLQDKVLELLKAAAGEVGSHKFSLSFLLTEWEQVVDAWQLETWEAYRDVTPTVRDTLIAVQD